MPLYRLVDLRPESEFVVDNQQEAGTPEEAAKIALGLDLVRSGRPRDLVVRAYWNRPDQPTNMVRLYARVANPRFADQSDAAV